MTDSSLPWREVAPFDGSPESMREHARAIADMVHGDSRLWLGSFARPHLLGSLASTRTERASASDRGAESAPEQADDSCATNPCAGCTCAKAGSVLADPDPEEFALVVPTSGSTGTPKAVAHSLQSLKASMFATARFFEGHGAWLPLLPPTHIGGVQVIARAALASLLLGIPDREGLPGALGPVVDLSSSFTADTMVQQLSQWDALAASHPELADLPLFTSLVPTQVERVVSAAEAAPDGASAHALRRFRAILVGGASMSPQLRARAERLGARIVATYGASETAGGCVYDGEPLQGVEVKVTDDGRLALTAPQVALGYVFETGAVTHVSGNTVEERARFFAMPSLAKTRLFVSSDMAEVRHDAATGGVRVSILGRSDDVIVSGGRKIVPQVVEAAIVGAAPGAIPDLSSQALVVPVPDQEWGQAAIALLEGPGAPAHEEESREASPRTSDAIAAAILAAGQERFMIPRRTFVVNALPILASGKVDRAAAAALARAAVENAAVENAAVEIADGVE